MRISSCFFGGLARAVRFFAAPCGSYLAELRGRLAGRSSGEYASALRWKPHVQYINQGGNYVYGSEAPANFR
jgi:hypothetical protein